MSKDPAFLFYPGDWLGGTLGMTFEEKGAYMELLMMQFNRGHMTSHMIGQVVGQLWVTLQVKFIQDEKGHWYNIRLEEEQNKRKTFVDTRKNNLSGLNQYSKKAGHMDGHKTSHMENENENKDEIKNEIKKPVWAKNFKNYHAEIIYPFELPEFCQIWDLWIDYRKEKHLSAYKKIGEQSALKKLSEKSNGNFQTAKLIIDESISNNWQGLFELKNKNNGRGEKFDGKNWPDEYRRIKAEMSGRSGCADTPAN